MRAFGEWKSYYEAHAEPADPIEGASLYDVPSGEGLCAAVEGASGFEVQYARGRCIFENRRMLWI